MQVFMVVFDIMHSHFSMMQWHEARLVQHRADLANIQAAKAACKQQILQKALAAQFLNPRSCPSFPEADAIHNQAVQPSTAKQQTVGSPKKGTLPLPSLPSRETASPALPVSNVPVSGQSTYQSALAPVRMLSSPAGQPQHQASTQQPPAQTSNQPGVSQQLSNQELSGPASSSSPMAVAHKPTVRFVNEAHPSYDAPSLAGHARPWQAPHGFRNNPLHTPQAMPGLSHGSAEANDVQQQRRDELQVSIVIVLSLLLWAVIGVTWDPSRASVIQMRGTPKTHAHSASVRATQCHK